MGGAALSRLHARCRLWLCLVKEGSSNVRRREAAALKLQCFRRGNGGRAAARAARQMSQTASLAAAELEFLGVARPVKRRKVEYMQRTAFPLDQLLGEDGL